jgi:predicted small lipoprotein YifL
MTYFLPRVTHHALLVVISLLLITMLAACGRKGPVRPRLASLPAAPTEVSIAQQGDDFIVSWRIPERNQDGAPAEDLFAFHIYRMVYAAADGCPTCRDPEELVATITLNHPEPAVRIGKHLYWRDQLVAPGTGHAYLIVPVTLGGYEGNAAGTHRAWQEPPPSPVDLQAESGDQQVRLTWTAPAALPAGQLLLGYNIYRRPATGTFLPMPLNADPLREPRLTDRAGEGGREAVYRVTTLVRSGEQLVESHPSAEAAATPQGVR